jgi:non-specific serine/threonine protein kinase
MRTKNAGPRRETSTELMAPSAHGLDSPPLLTALQTLSPNDVYTMAPKESVVRGYDYYKQQRLRRYEWGHDHSVLTASVQGQANVPYAVIFFFDEGFLTASCNCPAWDPDRLCKHVLCACFTTKNLLSPNTFRLSWFDGPHRGRLEAELLGSERHARPGAPVGSKGGFEKGGAAGSKTGLEVVIDARHNPPSLFLRRDGMKLTWSSGVVPRQPLPPELVPLLYASGYQPSYGEDPLLRYLRRDRATHPLILETHQEAVTLRWDPSTACLCKTALDADENQITIRAACLADGIELKRFVHFRSFVADLDGRRLLHVEDEQGWNPWRAIHRGLAVYGRRLSDEEIVDHGVRQALLPSPSVARQWQSQSEMMAMTLSLPEFHAAQIDVIVDQVDKVARDLILTADGRPQSLLRRGAVPEEERLYRLILIPPSPSEAIPGALYKLRAECRSGRRIMAPSASVFGLFPYLEQAPTLSAPLRARKRTTVLYEAFFGLLSVTDQKERDRRIKSALHRDEFRLRSIMSEAQWILRHALAAFTRRDLRLSFDAGRWELRPVDKAREALLYRIPAEVLGLGIFRGMYRCDEMAVDPTILFRALPKLLEKLTAAGIQLLYRDKPVQISRWDCILEVERGAPDATGIDWFEIRPEIRCEGMVLDEAQWRKALQQGGLLDTKHGLRVLDHSTLERLRAILDFTSQDTAAKKSTQIVRVPRLQILDWLALREQGITVSLPVEDETVLAKLLEFQRITVPPLPGGVNATLRPYQMDGYGWLAFLYEHRFGACLADDMGLGKTLQAICLLAAIKEGLVRPPAGVNGPHLVVAPTSLLFNWEQELARFAPELKVRVLSGGDPTLDAGDGEVVLTTYGLVRRHIDTLERTAFHVVLFDEAQAVKNIFADTTGAVRRLKRHFTIAMTGTPLENHLGEYFSVIDLCLPGLLGDYGRFKTEFKRVQNGALDRLLRRTRPFILRRTKAQILHDLPPKIESEVFLDLTDRQKTLYRQTVDQVRSTIDEAYRTQTPGQAQFIALTAILKLRQVCLSPGLLTKREEEPSPKLSFLMEKLPILLDEGHSALIFSQFTGFLDLVQHACNRHAIPYHRLDGSTASTARKARVKKFQTAEKPGVFLLSLKAGGQGLNLTRATYIFHLDPWWNPAVENQASDRAHRIGQQRTVSILRLLMRHSIEEKMIALKQRKLDLYEAVMRGTVRGAGQGALTRADFEFLLSPGSGPTVT